MKRRIKEFRKESIKLNWKKWWAMFAKWLFLSITLAILGGCRFKEEQIFNRSDSPDLQNNAGKLFLSDREFLNGILDVYGQSVDPRPLTRAESEDFRAWKVELIAGEQPGADTLSEKDYLRMLRLQDYLSRNTGEIAEKLYTKNSISPIESVQAWYNRDSRPYLSDEWKQVLRNMVLLELLSEEKLPKVENDLGRVAYWGSLAKNGVGKQARGVYGPMAAVINEGFEAYLRMALKDQLDAIARDFPDHKATIGAIVNYADEYLDTPELRINAFKNLVNVFLYDAQTKAPSKSLSEALNIQAKPLGAKPSPDVRASYIESLKSQSTELQARLFTSLVEDFGPAMQKILQAVVPLFGDEFKKQVKKVREALPPMPQEVLLERIQDLEARQVWGRGVTVKREKIVNIGTASVGDAYLVELSNGREMVIKFQKPGRRADLEREKVIFNRIIKSIEPNDKKSASSLRMQSNAYIRTSEAELNFSLEQDAIEMLRKSKYYQGKHQVREPFDLQDASGKTRRVTEIEFDVVRNLTPPLGNGRFRDNLPFEEGVVMMEKAQGTSLNKLTLEAEAAVMSAEKLGDVEGTRQALKKLSQLRKIVDQAYSNWLVSAIKTGVFHGDPQPANLFLDLNSIPPKVTYIDMGGSGKIDSRYYKNFSTLLFHISQGEADSAFHILRDLCKKCRLLDSKKEANLRGDLSEKVRSILSETYIYDEKGRVLEKPIDRLLPGQKEITPAKRLEWVIEELFNDPRLDIDPNFESFVRAFGIYELGMSELYLQETKIASRVHQKIGDFDPKRLPDMEVTRVHTFESRLGETIWTRATMKKVKRGFRSFLTHPATIGVGVAGVLAGTAAAVAIAMSERDKNSQEPAPEVGDADEPAQPLSFHLSEDASEGSCFLVESKACISLVNSSALNAKKALKSRCRYLSGTYWVKGSPSCGFKSLELLCQLPIPTSAGLQTLQVLTLGKNLNQEICQQLQ